MFFSGDSLPHNDSLLPDDDSLSNFPSMTQIAVLTLNLPPYVTFHRWLYITIQALPSSRASLLHESRVLEAEFNLNFPKFNPRNSWKAWPVVGVFFLAHMLLH